MRILHVTDLYPPVIGGLEVAVQATAQDLVRRGHEVEVLTQGFDGAPLDQLEEGVRVRRVRGVSSVLGRFYDDPRFALHPTVPDPVLVRAVRGAIERFQPDVVHAHGWIAYSVMAGVGPRASGRLVVGLHDYGLVCAKKTYVHRAATCSGPGLVKCVGCAVEHYGYVKGPALSVGLAASSRLHGRVDCFVANSNAVAAASRARLPRLAEVVVIPPPSPPASAPGGRPSFLPRADGYVLYIGALETHKGVDVLLDAYERFGLGAPLVLVGTRHHEMTRPLPEGVTVAYEVPHDDVLAALAHASVAVVPSLWPEPFGLVAVEAMAAGRPVVASAVGGLAELVDPGVTGTLVAPGDVGALARAVRALTGDPVSAARLGEAGRHRAERYATDRVVDEVEDLYVRLARPVRAEPSRSM